MSWTLSARDFVLGVVVGVALALLLAAVVVAMLLRSSDLYSLGHWKLNLRTPLDSMWLNLGYWKDADGEPVQRFDEACLGLLRETLKTAGLLGRGAKESANPRRALSVLDLGFGCGDQTLALARLVQPRSSHDFRYVGLTLDRSQHQTALRRLHRELPSSSDVGPSLESSCFHLYRADAAKPDSWSPDIRDAVRALADPDFPDRWLLALDCLPFFSPSRKPVFRHAARELDANVLAFDLILNEKASRWHKFLARLVGWVLGCPWRALLTEDEYRAEMRSCGYDEGLVLVRDVSDDVFAGIANYLRRQEEALSLYGISIGGFKLTGHLFEWFDRSRVVKAAIVVGRTHGKGQADSHQDSASATSTAASPLVSRR
ncbi:hypothetical protein CDD83_1835 [Cordyceps sp. RAO-2017]|nr:hypothetical protein CDD83_1835 [Cordyceps sp. RAO-2017]